MSTEVNIHDEALFQRVNRARAQYVAALRAALNAAGLKEKGAAVPNNWVGVQAQVQGGQMITNTEDYDIERVIASASAIIAALEPFNTATVN